MAKLQETTKKKTRSRKKATRTKKKTTTRRTRTRSAAAGNAAGPDDNGEAEDAATGTATATATATQELVGESIADTGDDPAVEVKTARKAKTGRDKTDTGRATADREVADGAVDEELAAVEAPADQAAADEVAEPVAPAEQPATDEAAESDTPADQTTTDEAAATDTPADQATTAGSATADVVDDAAVADEVEAAAADTPQAEADLPGESAGKPAGPDRTGFVAADATTETAVSGEPDAPSDAEAANPPDAPSDADAPATEVRHDTSVENSPDSDPDPEREPSGPDHAGATPPVSAPDMVEYDDPEPRDLTDAELTAAVREFATELPMTTDQQPAEHPPAPQAAWRTLVPPLPGWLTGRHTRDAAIVLVLVALVLTGVTLLNGDPGPDGTLMTIDPQLTGGGAAEQERLAYLEEHPDLPPLVRHAIANDGVVVGMTKEELLLVCGPPDETHAGFGQGIAQSYLYQTGRFREAYFVRFDHSDRVASVYTPLHGRPAVAVERADLD